MTTIIRFVCLRHNVDLEPDGTTGDGNPEAPLFRIRYAENFGPGPSPYDVKLAENLGIIDQFGYVRKPGHWYVTDLSNFLCPEAPEMPDFEGTEEEMSAQEDHWYNRVFCIHEWDAIFEVVTDASTS